MTEDKKPVKQVDVVSQDRNWVLRINSELESEKKWDHQWGYLSAGFSPEKTNMKPSITDKIKQLEEEVSGIGSDSIFCRTNDTYGKGQKVEIFDSTKNNLKENKQLTPLERRLPKNWKKAKWTPPVDPFDPLANMTKKKK